MNSINETELDSIHDKYAPYWGAGLVILGVTGLSTLWIDLGPFWNGYVLDITGPGWSYILFRGLFTARKNNAWTRFFSPERTFIIFVLVCVSIETMQYLEIYESTFDPWDFLAYFSVLIPLFMIDRRIVSVCRKKSLP
jgi:hypothetical protein